MCFSPLGGCAYEFLISALLSIVAKTSAKTPTPGKKVVTPAVGKKTKEESSDDSSDEEDTPPKKAPVKGLILDIQSALSYIQNLSSLTLFLPFQYQLPK